MCASMVIVELCVYSNMGFFSEQKVKSGKKVKKSKLERCGIPYAYYFVGSIAQSYHAVDEAIECYTKVENQHCTPDMYASQHKSESAQGAVPPDMCAFEHDYIALSHHNFNIFSQMPKLPVHSCLLITIL